MTTKSKKDHQVKQSIATVCNGWRHLLEASKSWSNQMTTVQCNGSFHWTDLCTKIFSSQKSFDSVLLCMCIFRKCMYKECHSFVWLFLDFPGRFPTGIWIALQLKCQWNVKAGLLFTLSEGEVVALVVHSQSRMTCGVSSQTWWFYQWR